MRFSSLRLSLFIAALAVPIALSAQSQSQLRRHARIRPAAARRIALQREPGRILSAELEKEHGRIIYTYSIRTAHHGYREVNVDARNGRIVEDSKESRAEARSDAREAREAHHPHKHGLV